MGFGSTITRAIISGAIQAAKEAAREEAKSTHGKTPMIDFLWDNFENDKLENVTETLKYYLRTIIKECDHGMKYGSIYILTPQAIPKDNDVMLECLTDHKHRAEQLLKLLDIDETTS